MIKMLLSEFDDRRVEPDRSHFFTRTISLQARAVPKEEINLEEEKPQLGESGKYQDYKIKYLLRKNSQQPSTEIGTENLTDIRS